MPHFIINKYVSLFLLVLLWIGCEYRELPCPEEERFCNLIENQSFKMTGDVINDYLKTLEYNYDPHEPENHKTNLKILRDWLACKSCVAHIKIYDYIITTNPPQKEMGLTFITKKRRLDTIMDIHLLDTLEFIRYH